MADAAEALSRVAGRTGAVAFSRTGDPDTASKRQTHARTSPNYPTSFRLQNPTSDLGDVRGPPFLHVSDRVYPTFSSDYPTSNFCKLSNNDGQLSDLSDLITDLEIY
jgi:hypothetical protein